MKFSLQGLKRLFRPTPLWGEEVARKARQHGVLLGQGGYAGGAIRPVAQMAHTEWLNNGLTKLRANTQVYDMADPNSIPDNFKGVVLNTVAAPWKFPRGATVMGKTNGEIVGDKLREAKVFTGFQGKTIPLASVLPAVKLDAKTLNGRFVNRNSPQNRALIHAELQKQLGPKYILKATEGAASRGGLTTEARGNIPASPRDYIAQQRFELKPTSGLERTIDRLFTLHKENPKMGVFAKLKQAIHTRDQVGIIEGATSSTGKGTVEYRVPTVAGKAIPYGAIRRGSGIGALNPIHTPEMRRVEQYAQSILDKVPKKYRDLSYGMDIGIDRLGNPVMIEANPSTGGDALSASGFLGHPFSVDAMRAAARGETPMRIKLQRGALGAAVGLPAVGVGRHLMHKKEAGFGQAVSEGLGRYTSLLTGSQYWKRKAMANAMEAHIPKVQSPAVQAALKKSVTALREVNDNENAKVWGTRFGTAAGVAGTAGLVQAAKNQAQDPHAQKFDAKKAIVRNLDDIVLVSQKLLPATKFAGTESAFDWNRFF